MTKLRGGCEQTDHSIARPVSEAMNDLRRGALSGTDLRFARLVLRVTHVLDIPSIVSDSIVRGATSWDRAHQLRRHRWRLCNRSARCRLSQRSNGKLHRRVSLCRGDADHGCDLYDYRDRTDPHCNADAESKHRLTTARPPSDADHLVPETGRTGMRFTKCGLQTRAGAIAVTLLLSFALMPGTARAQDKTYLKFRHRP